MYINKLFLFLFLIVGFVPNLGSSDVNATQALYISIINFSSFLYIFYQKERRLQFLKDIVKNYYFGFYLLFFIWAFTTSFFAFNQMESFRVLTQFASFMIAILPFSFFLKSDSKSNFNWVLNVIPILLCLEIATIIIPYLINISNNILVARSANYSGITGNINIAAFSIVIKLPFIWYHLFSNKSNFKLKIILVFIYTLGLYSIITIHETRGAILSILVLIFLTLIYFLIKRAMGGTSFKLLEFFKKCTLLIIPLIIVFLINLYQGYIKNQNNVLDRFSTLTQEQLDSSSTERLRYYGQALSSISKKPILGVGIGNWPLESVKRDIDFISNYVVAYHVHNDFLEILAETGIFGFFFFFAPILIVVFLLIKHIRSNKFNFSVDIHFFLLLSILGYMMDSMLNFPFSRPIQLTHLVITILLAISLLEADKLISKIKLSNNLTKLLIGFVFLIIPINIYANYRVYNSNKEQFILLGQFNSNKLIEPLENVLKYEEDFPNLSGTTIPLSTFKGMYLNHNERHEEAIPYFRKGIKENPYLYVNEAYLGWSYFQLRKIDSARYYTEKAFNNLKNNSIHYAYYMATLSIQKDTLSIKKAYSEMKELSSEEYVDNVYLIAMSTVLGKTNSQDIIEKANTRLLETNDVNTVRGIYVLNFGEKATQEAHNAHQIGLQFFETKNFEIAVKFFEKATQLNNLEAPYFENAGNAYLKLGQHEKAAYFLDYVLDNLNPQSPKANYLKALLLLQINKDKDNACSLLIKANKNGHPLAARVYNNYCK